MDTRPDDHDRPGALTHDRLCGHCGHAVHHGVLCSATCSCTEAH